MLISLMLAAATTVAVQDFEAACNDYVANTPETQIDCSCLVAAADENPSIGEELLAVDPSDLSGLSEETLKALEDCGGNV